MRWRVYYSDGATFSEDDGEPEEAPARGVVAIACWDREHGRQVIAEFDFYWWSGDPDCCWYGGDVFGLWDHLSGPGWKRVLFGRSVPTARFREVMGRATSDPGLPVKTGRRRFAGREV